MPPETRDYVPLLDLGLGAVARTKGEGRGISHAYDPEYLRKSYIRTHLRKAESLSKCFHSSEPSSAYNRTDLARKAAAPACGTLHQWHVELCSTDAYAVLLDSVAAAAHPANAGRHDSHALRLRRWTEGATGLDDALKTSDEWRLREGIY